MASNPFLAPRQHHRALDFCFYKMCWQTAPSDLIALYPSLTRPIDLDAIAQYLIADRPDHEYISAFFPQQRAADLCRHKMHHGWSDQRIAAAFPKTTALTQLSALRQQTLELHRSQIRYLMALKTHLKDHAFIDHHIAMATNIGKRIAKPTTT